MNLKTEITDLLNSLGACSEAVRLAQEWADSGTNLTAWQACRRGDWMMWLLAKTTVDENDPRYRLLACDFAEAVLHLVPAGEDRPRMAIEVARKFAVGEASQDQMGAAGDAARDAARDAAWAARSAAWAAVGSAGAAGDAARAARVAAWAAGDAAWAARVAARAARVAAWAAGDAAWAARVAAWAAGDAAWAAQTAKVATWDETLASQADIIRKYFPTCPEIKGKP